MYRLESHRRGASVTDKSFTGTGATEHRDSSFSSPSRPVSQFPGTTPLQACTAPTASILRRRWSWPYCGLTSLSSTSQTAIRTDCPRDSSEGRLPRRSDFNEVSYFDCDTAGMTMRLQARGPPGGALENLRWALFAESSDIVISQIKKGHETAETRFRESRTATGLQRQCRMEP